MPKPPRAPYPAAAKTALSRSVRNWFQIGSVIAGTPLSRHAAGSAGRDGTTAPVARAALARRFVWFGNDRRLAGSLRSWNCQKRASRTPSGGRWRRAKCGPCPLPKRPRRLLGRVRNRAAAGRIAPKIAGAGVARRNYRFKAELWPPPSPLLMGPVRHRGTTALTPRARRPSGRCAGRCASAARARSGRWCGDRRPRGCAADGRSDRPSRRR